MVSETVAEPRAASVACAHCGLPAPRPPREGDPAFCCQGCRGAYELIRGWGLDDYYALRDQLGGSGVGGPVRPPDRFDELDDPEALGASAPEACGDGLLQTRLAVDGLHCGACSWLIERAARRQPGFESARVRLNDHSVEIVFRPEQTSLSRIARQLARLGYRLSPLAADGGVSQTAMENRKLLVQIAIAGFCAANAMWIAVALYAGMFSGIAGEHATVLRWAGVLLGLLAVAVPGRTFFRGALASLRTRTPHMDLPVALGLSVGAASGVVAAASGRGEVYFDSIAVLVFLLLVGRWVQFRQQRRAADAVSLLMRLTPRMATRVAPDGQATRRVLADRLSVGDTVRVAAGETVPVDGEMAAGESFIDRSLVTGESRPVKVGIGDHVEAGCANLGGSIDILVKATGRDTRVGRLTQLIEDASSARPPIVQWADSIGGWFVTVVIVLASATMAIWFPRDPYAAAENAVALLIVACPCALALATPLALAVAIGRAASHGLLVRGGDVLERLSRRGIVWFDKTGTLTEGRMTLIQWDGDAESLALAAALERSSAHPFAQAVCRAAEDRGLAIGTAVDSRQISGLGMEGTVAGVDVRVGNRRFMEQAAVVMDTAVDATVGRITAIGLSPLLVAVDGRVRAVASLGDSLRPDAAAAVAKLRQAGWRVGILSGDHPSAVQHVADRLGVDESLARGGRDPEAKLQTIHESKRGGRVVVMVGDGVNDAAALAAADVGVAAAGGASASLDAAPVYLQDGRLSGLVDLIAASSRTVRLIRRNFVLSLAYNVAAVLLAMLGLINPLIAAVLMPLSSLTVLGSVLASRTFARDADERVESARAFAAPRTSPATALGAEA